MLHSFIKNGKERKDRCVFLKRMDAQPCSWLHIHVSLESSCFGIGHQLGISVSWHHCVKFASNSFWANNVSATTFTNVSFSCGAVQNSFLRVSVFFSFIIQCTQLIGRKKGLYFHDWAPPSSSCSNSWGWLHGGAGRQLQSPLYCWALAEADVPLWWAQGKARASARQQSAESLRRCWDLGWQVISYALN